MKINKTRLKSLLLIGFPVAFLITASVIILANSFSNNTKVTIKTDTLKDISSNANTETKLSYTIVSDGELASLPRPGRDGVVEFIKKLETQKGEDAYLPGNFSNNSTIDRTESEQTNGKRDHYYLSQTIDGKRVFGSYFSVHAKNGTEVYFLSSNLTKNSVVEKANLTHNEAKDIAFAKVTEEDESEQTYNVYPIVEVIYNKELFGVDDSKNYPTAIIRIESGSDTYLFDNNYYVNLTNGEILLVEELLPDVKQRSVYNCHENASITACTLDRTEGSSPVSDEETNRSYDILGKVYDYFYINFQRDSLDGAGLPLRAYVHRILVNSAGQNKCPNASYGNGTMHYCTGLVIEDVTAHEFTHGVTNSTAGLIYQSQSGALNEAVSDIFASNFDNNWTIGEGSVVGIIRDMQNPPAIRGSLGYYPDRLFSQNYYCGYSDHEGVHHNSSIPNKAYFLMTDGGSFNGCTISGIGRTRSQQIMYQALTRYMNSSSNFRHAYTAIVQACDDLYSSDPGVCEQVTKALQATEMDQQPAGTMAGPRCSSATPQTPACAGGSSSPGITITPFPTTTSGGGGTTPGNYKVTGKVYIDADNSGTFNSGDTPYRDADLELSDGPKTGSVRTDASGDYALLDYPSGLYTITLSILGSKKEEKPVVLGPDQTIDFRIFSTLTEPTIVPKPTIKLGPTIADGPTPTPTPVPHVCEFDPSCAAQKKNLQLCKLICRPKT